MIVLDTDAVSHLQKEDRVGDAIRARLDASPDRDVRITAVTAYEVMGGATALIDRRKRDRGDLVSAFALLGELVEYPGLWRGLILPFDSMAEVVHRSFPPRLRQELKDDARIAAVSLAHSAALWTLNVTDYLRVPGLDVFRADTGAKTSLTGRTRGAFDP